MTLKNNRAPLLTYSKLCASFHNHWWIQTGFTVQKRPIWVKIGDYFSSVTFKFDRCPWKTIGHLSYTTSSFVHHFLTIGEFELESGKAQFRSKSVIFCPLWPWNLMHDWKTLGYLPLLCYVKLCASFYSHQWIQTGVTIGKHPIRVKISIFCHVGPWNFTEDLEKQ